MLLAKPPVASTLPSPSRVAGDESGSDARPSLACVELRASVAVVARGPVGGGRVGAHARRRVAGARRVACIRGATGDRRAADAHPTLARIGLGAAVPVIA